MYKDLSYRLQTCYSVLKNDVKADFSIKGVCDTIRHGRASSTAAEQKNFGGTFWRKKFWRNILSDHFCSAMADTVTDSFQTKICFIDIFHNRIAFL